MYQAFLDALSAAGIPSTGTLILDGRFRRYNVAGDKKGRRNGWYRFTRFRDDFAIGVFGCNKRGISEKWCSHEKRLITKYDEKKIREHQAAIKKEEEETQARIAIKANRIWQGLRTPTAHPYTTRKRVGLYNVREMTNALVVPIYDTGYLVSLQFITDSGEKRFLSGGQTKGGYSGIGEESDTIYICEGYATCATIYEATGMMTVAAFYANNLVPVAMGFRNKYPNKKIILAADNDQFTAKNPGLSAAREAAEKISATVVYPDFSYEDKDKPTDWNDYFIKFGLDATRDALLGIKKNVVVAVADEHAWRLHVIEGKQELAGFRPFDPKSKMNVYLFMANHDRYRGIFAYNEFTDKIMLRNCPPWDADADFIPREICEYDAAMLVADLEKIGIKTNKDIVYDFIARVAKNNKINPPRDYFNSLVWDRKPRLNNWLTYYLGAEKQDAEYLRLVGSKWMMAIVARIFVPGTKFDNVLVLEGGQGIKKTTAFEVLATFNGENCFLEFGGDVTNKDSLELMQGKVIVEMSELASVRKSEIEDMKLFISRRIDEYRPPYGRMKIKRPRFFILGGSTNKVGQEYLEDETGARRIWPIACGNMIDLEALKLDQPQLYAEAIHRYKAGERIWLEGDEVALAKYEQSTRQAEDGWDEKISIYLEMIKETTTLDIASGLKLEAKDLSTRVLSRIKSSLNKIGWEEKRIDGKRKWRRKEDIIDRHLRIVNERD